MASRVRGEHRTARPSGTKRAARLIGQAAIAALFIAVVAFKVFSYVDPSVLSPSAVSRDISKAAHGTSSMVGNLPILNSCPDGLAMRDVPGGYVCAQGAAANADEEIYQTYPLAGGGRESVYSSEDDGNLAQADDLLQNKYDIPGYAAMQLPGLPAWSEDPNGSKDWRLAFYSLRPSLNLLYAFRTTGNAAYAKKLTELDLSFIAAEPKSRFAWSDPHAASLRALALVDTWWKLRQDGQLSEQASTAILTELEKTGQFLADDNNYQSGSTNTIDEAAALYEISVAFPALPHAQQWLDLARQRFQWQLDGLIDSDGRLIDNASYDDFSALQKYAEIYQYSTAQKSAISSEFPAKLATMTRFATYALQPNSQIPLLGASIEATINDNGAFQQLGAANPQLSYVLTHGAKGTAPAQQSVYFPSSALSVMRSDWQSGAAFPDSTYLTYNIGKYRTAHSNLDALAITLYGDGGDLLPGPGLYTAGSAADRDYFHGTAAENTVVVDGKSQVQGNGTATSLVTADGLTYQSAESSLYDGVTHQRMVMMIDKDHILVVDRLNSATVHDYQQMFHLFPGARLTQSGLTVTGTGGAPARQVTIQQLRPQGITESAVINQRGAKPAGVCSQQSDTLVPCYQLAYSARGKSAEFITLLTVGKPQASTAASVAPDADGQHLTITEGKQRFAVNLGESAAKPGTARATDPTPPAVKATPVAASSSPANWTVDGSATLGFQQVADLGDAVVPRLTTASAAPSSLVNNAVRMNLVGNNARLPIEVDGLLRLRNLQLVVSNDHWAKTATLDLFNSIQRTQDGDWVTLFLGPGEQWGPRGGWVTSAPGFDWSAIDGLEIKTETKVSGGQPATVSVGGLSLIPGQSKGKIAIVFDDGYQSILPAASYLHENGMPGNVAVIGKYVDYPTLDHLNLDQLKQLQNAWGWNMVNHTQQHVDAVSVYYNQNNQEGYARDILQQAAWLEENGLNSAPNWFIYPHGDTNSELEGVVAQYYKFARVTQDDPESYPYGDPHAITNLEIQYPGDGGDGGFTGITTPAEIDSAVNQAIANHSTLILTFHRIKSVPGDPAGYPLALFKQTVDEIKQSGIQVMTLSQLDQSDGVPTDNHIYYQPGQPSQITVHVTAAGGGRLAGISWRLILWLVIALALALLLGFLLWARAHRGGAGGGGTCGVPGDLGVPPAASAPAQRGDAYDRQVLSMKPALYLPLNDPAAAVAVDLSGGRHQAVYQSGGRLGTARLPNGDLATVFDGDGQYVDVPSFKSLSIPGAGCLTVEAWIRPDVLQFPLEQGSGYVYVLGKGTAGKQEYGLRMYSYRNAENPPRPNRLSAYVFNLAGGLGSGAYVQDEVRPGAWMMIAFVVDARPSAQWPDGYVTLYKDGVRRGGPVSLGQFGVVPGESDAPFRIGTRDLESFFQGAIGKVAVYDSVLSGRQILATYQAMNQANG